MPIALRQSTASQEIPLGYFLDSTDGNTEKTALTIANTDIKLWKSGAITLANKNSGEATHISNGLYYTVLDATDTDTVGSMVVFCHPTGALAVRVECQVYEEAVFDALFAASASGYLQPTVAGRTLDVTATGAAGIDWGNVENPTANNYLTGTSIDSASAVGVATIDAGIISSTSFAAGAINAAALAADAVAEIADGVWDEAMAGHVSAGSTGNTLNAVGTVSSDLSGLINDIGSNGAGLTALPWNAAWDAEVQSEVQDAIEVNHLDHLLAVDYDPASKPGVATALLNELIESDAGVSRYTANALEQAPSGSGASAETIADAVWDEAIGGHLTAGSTGNALNAAGSAGDPWSTPLPGAYGAGTAGKIIGDNINAPIGTVDTVVDAIKAKTDNLPSDPADQSAVEAAITAATSPLATSTTAAAIKAKTDNLPASPAAVGSAMTLANDAVSAAALSAAAVDEILDEVVEGSVTVRQVLRALLSLAAGKTARAGSTIYLRDFGDTKNRISLTVDSNADRTAVVTDLT